MYTWNICVCITSLELTGQFLPCNQSTGLSCPNMLCPNSSVIYTCEITNPRGITQWTFPTGTCTNSGDMIALNQDTLLNCVKQVAVCGPFAATNNVPTNGACTTSTLSVLVTNQLNGTMITCSNAGGAYRDIIGYATITLAGILV